MNPDNPLEDLLRASDLDDLMRARRRLSSLTGQETVRVESIIRAWTDRQATANLLFNADVIPAGVRFGALERALRDGDVPYFALAATVGLQGIALKDVPDHLRSEYLHALMRFVREPSQVMAGRASVVLFDWCQNPEPLDILPQVLSLHPVPDKSASRNIVAAALARFCETSAQDLSQILIDWGVLIETRAVIQTAHEKYRAVKGGEPVRAMSMKAPVLAYIPNLRDFSNDEAIAPEIEPAEHHEKKKPWWRPW